MSRRPVLQSSKVCDFYDKETHRCFADGTSICFDPHLVKEEACETARNTKKLDAVINANATKLDVTMSNLLKE